MKRLFKIVSLTFVWLALTGWAFGQKNELPGESLLPGKRLIEIQLPDESSLPGSEGQLTAVQLPSESEIPSEQTPDEKEDVADAQQEENVLRGTENRPWLRLNADGPTAPLRAIAFASDSKQIFAGGLDKALHVWSLAENPQNQQESWAYDKAVFWQVQRGARGQVKSVSANSKFVAFGGYGASVAQGEIVLTDAKARRFQLAVYDIKEGHTATISCLAAAKDQAMFAATDLAGRVIAWSRDLDTGKWEPKTVRESDVEVSGQELGDYLLKWRKFANPLAVTADGHVLYAELSQKPKLGEPPVWNLIDWNPVDGKKTQIAMAEGEIHHGAIAAVSCSDDGRRMASTDLKSSGQIFLWSGQRAIKTIQFDQPLMSLFVSSSGKYLVAGAMSARNKAPRLTIWEWKANDQLVEVATIAVSETVHACAISPDETTLAYTQGNRIVVRSLEPKDDNSIVLSTSVASPSVVAFSAAHDDYRFAFGTQQADENANKFQWLFNTRDLQLKEFEANDADKWIAAMPNPAWKIVTGQNWHVVLNDKLKCMLPINSDDGVMTSLCWISDQENPDRPAAVAIGTNRENHVYLFKIPDSGDCQLVRQYRGHSDAPISLSYSPDRTYLISAGRDATIRIWKMDDAISQDVPQRLLENKWGATFAAADDKLTVTDIIADGPLYFRGIRKGDVISRLEIVGPKETLAFKAAKDILNELKNADRGAQFVFRYRRAAAQQSPFSLRPAWQPLVSFIWNREREWAYWTPYISYRRR